MAKWPASWASGLGPSPGSGSTRPSSLRAGPIAATRRACGELDAEAAFFAALADVSLAEVSGPVLALSNEAGVEMVFRAE